MNHTEVWLLHAPCSTLAVSNETTYTIVQCTAGLPAPAEDVPLPQMLGGTDGNFLAATLCIAELLHHFGDVLGVATKPTFLQLHVRDPVFPPFSLFVPSWHAAWLAKCLACRSCQASGLHR